MQNFIQILHLKSKISALLEMKIQTSIPKKSLKFKISEEISKISLIIFYFVNISRIS